MRCLESVLECWPVAVSCQIIVVDDESRDSTPAVVAALPGVDYIRNGVNAGFIRSCNRGSTLARGRYICFLNNDTIVTPGWIEELVRVGDAEPTVGAVGSKLVYPDGRLQEAGGIIWRDGSGWNYGRGQDASEPRFNFMRDVDYCSGAALMVRTDLFTALGGFSELYVPAYYEDVDFCFALRQNGHRVVYQPLSVVIHDEGTSSGVSLDSGVKHHQVLNAPKFVEKWRLTLEENLEHHPSRGELAARRLGRPRKILMIDNYVPEFDKDAGSDRMFNLIQQFQRIGYDVIFLPDNYYRSEPYTSILQRMGVEVMYRTDASPSQVDALRERLPILDLAWVSRPEVGERFLPVLRERNGLPVIYDTVDLHFVRIKRKLELKQITDRATWEKWEAERDAELRIIKGADLTIVTADGERDTLAKEGVNDMYVIPTMHHIVKRTIQFPDTNGVLFIGGYQHPPNADAAVWLVTEIMPIVWGQRPEIVVTLLGSNPTKEVLELASDRVKVPGYFPDVSPFFERARVFVAPLRWGAGIKAKVGHAFGYGLPTVTTTIGAEGFGITDGVDALIVDGPDAFARAVLRLYADEKFWNLLSEGATRVIEPFTPDAVGARLQGLADAANDSARRKALC